MRDLEQLIAERDLAINASKANSERATIVQEFVEEINKEREGTKWKLVHGRAIAMKLGHIKKKEDLYVFLSLCRKYKAEGKGAFGKYFFGALKAK